MIYYILSYKRICLQYKKNSEYTQHPPTDVGYTGIYNKNINLAFILFQSLTRNVEEFCLKSINPNKLGLMLD